LDIPSSPKAIGTGLSRRDHSNVGRRFIAGNLVSEFGLVPEGRLKLLAVGYGAFTVSVSHIGEKITYIQFQAEHHRLKSFQEEYVNFLQKHGIRFEERYPWD
jgi:hypothetical protein